MTKCYDIRFDDGTTGTYDPEELYVLPMKSGQRRTRTAAYATPASRKEDRTMRSGLVMGPKESTIQMQSN